MLPGSSMTVGLQITAMNPKTAPLDQEQYAQKHGHLVHLPCLRDRIYLLVGKFFINAGKKLTSASLEHMQSTEEAA
jgi:hypothetical protein